MPSRSTVDTLLTIGTSDISAGLANGESMSMFINMPTKNIYVSEADMELFEQAAQHAESVSAAVVQALQEYLTNRHNTEKGYGRIELALSKTVRGGR